MKPRTIAAPLTALLLTAVTLTACKPAAKAPAASPSAPAPAATSADAASPAEQRIGALVISGARTRETALSGVTAVGFLSIRNTGDTDDVLLAARSTEAGSIELHEMSMADGVMRMRALTEGLPIPAGATVTLGSGGTHLMLIGTKAAFSPGRTVAVELQFAKAGTATVQLKVEPLDATAGEAH